MQRCSYFCFFSLLEDVSISLIRISYNAFVSEKLSFQFFLLICEENNYVSNEIPMKCKFFELRAFHLVSHLSKIGEKPLCLCQE